MAFSSFNSRVAEHRTRLVCLGETPSPRVRCQLALFTYLLTYLLASCLRRAIASLAAAARGLSKAVSCASSPRDDASPHAVISKEGTM